MAEVYISSTEWYPVYYFEDEPEDDGFHWAKSRGYLTTVPDDAIERWKRIREEFDEMQDELRRLKGE